MPTAKRDPEIAALDTVLAALEQLDDEARGRVLDYAMRRLGMRELPPLATPVATVGIGTAASSDTGDGPTTVSPVPTSASMPSDIRSLREMKSPSSAIEMAALVAYYLSELAPDDERKPTVSTADLDKYFKQAGHPLPTRIGNTLPNAAAAGYLDTTAVRGEYKLNPVGYNLVTQTLPASAAGARTTSRKRSASKATSAKKKKSTATATPAKRATKKRTG